MKVQTLLVMKFFASGSSETAYAPSQPHYIPFSRGGGEYTYNFWLKYLISFESYCIPISYTLKCTVKFKNKKKSP